MAPLYSIAINRNPQNNIGNIQAPTLLYREYRPEKVQVVDSATKGALNKSPIDKQQQALQALRPHQTPETAEPEPLHVRTLIV